MFIIIKLGVHSKTHATWKKIKHWEENKILTKNYIFFYVKLFEIFRNIHFNYHKIK